MPGRPSEASWIACAARPGGSQRIHESKPVKLVAVILPSVAGLGHHLGEELVQREQRDDQERGEVPAAPRAQQAGQGRGHEPGQRDAEQHLQHHREHRDDHAERAAGQADRHAEQADHVGQRPGAGSRRGQQADGERAGAQRVEGQRGRVERAVHAEDQIGAISQPNANTVKMTAVRSTDVLLPRNAARTTNVPIASSTANTVLMMKEILAPAGRAQRVRSAGAASAGRGAEP